MFNGGGRYLKYRAPPVLRELDTYRRRRAAGGAAELRPRRVQMARAKAAAGTGVFAARQLPERHGDVGRTTGAGQRRSGEEG
jgi:hypothetical protein